MAYNGKKNGNGNLSKAMRGGDLGGRDDKRASSNEYCPFPKDVMYEGAGEPVGAPMARYDDSAARVSDRQKRGKSKLKDQKNDQLY